MRLLFVYLCFVVTCFMSVTSWAETLCPGWTNNTSCPPNNATTACYYTKSSMSSDDSGTRIPTNCYKCPDVSLFSNAAESNPTTPDAINKCYITCPQSYKLQLPNNVSLATISNSNNPTDGYFTGDKDNGYYKCLYTNIAASNYVTLHNKTITINCHDVFNGPITVGNNNINIDHFTGQISIDLTSCYTNSDNGTDYDAYQCQQSIQNNASSAGCTAHTAPTHVNNDCNPNNDICVMQSNTYSISGGSDPNFSTWQNPPSTTYTLSCPGGALSQEETVCTKSCETLNTGIPQNRESLSGTYTITLTLSNGSPVTSINYTDCHIQVNTDVSGTVHTTAAKQLDIYKYFCSDDETNCTTSLTTRPSGCNGGWCKVSDYTKYYIRCSAGYYTDATSSTNNTNTISYKVGNQNSVGMDYLYDTIPEASASTTGCKEVGKGYYSDAINNKRIDCTDITTTNGNTSTSADDCKLEYVIFQDNKQGFTGITTTP